jgi:hypothetical protein
VSQVPISDIDPNIDALMGFLTFPSRYGLGLTSYGVMERIDPVFYFFSLGCRFLCKFEYRNALSLTSTHFLDPIKDFYFSFIRGGFLTHLWS